MTSLFFNPYVFSSVAPAPADLYTMTLPFTFTNMGATGVIGPTSINYGASTPGTGTAYVLTLGSGVRTGMQIWTVPTTKTWTITAAGAGTIHPVSGNCNGMVCRANYNLTRGQTIVILVGQSGLATGFNGYGGSGGTYVVDAVTNTPIIVAGGGGGGGNDGASATAPISPAGATPYLGGGAGGTAGNGGQGCPGVSPTSNFGEAGGGGFNTGVYPTGGNGGPPTVGNPSNKQGGISFLNGGGNATLVTGGFGGGGDSKRLGSSGGVGGGGGGGYSGGGGGLTGGAGYPGGAGGSFGTTSYSGTSLTPIGTNNAMGYVIVT
jgi:hypothetical protein